MRAVLITLITLATLGATVVPASAQTRPRPVMTSNAVKRTPTHGAY